MMIGPLSTSGPKATNQPLLKNGQSTAKVSTEDSRWLIGQSESSESSNHHKLSSYAISRLSRCAIYISNKLLSFILYIAHHSKNQTDEILLPLSPEKKNDVSRMLDQIAEDMKNNIRQKGTEHIRNDVQQTFITLELMNNEKQWTTTGLESINQQLTDKDIINNVDDMIDSIVRNLKDNECLMHAFFAMMESADVNDNVPERIKSGLQASLPFMLALNLLTEEQTKNTTLLEQCVQLWQEKRRQAGGSVKRLGLKKTIKLISVEKPLRKIIAGKKQADFPSSLGRCILPFNIIEATAIDVINGNFSNARAGLTLAKNYPGKYCKNAATMDQGEIRFHYPLPKQWDDLYTSWNMAFCSDSSEWPLYFSKLLIPSVSGYKDNPESYIFRRANALYTTLNYVLSSEDLKTTTPAFTPAMGKAWSKVNRQYANLYQRKVHQMHRGKSSATTNSQYEETTIGCPA